MRPALAAGVAARLMAAVATALSQMLASRPFRRSLRVAVALAASLGLVFIVGFTALALTAWRTPLPPELDPGSPRHDVSLRVVDRNGVLLREVRANDGVRARWISLAEVGPNVRAAVVAAEDSRFYLHPGVDPIAIGRAMVQNVWQRRIVSGASTLTQQLARLVWHRPRTLGGKFHEAALALRIEWSLSKERVLEEYLNRAPFGPGLRGVEAASAFYFGKATRDLSLAEAATLASLPRGPTLYDPRRGTTLVLRRRNRVLERMRTQGLAADEDVRRATAEQLVLAHPKGGYGAPHFVQAVLGGGLLAGRGNEARTVWIDDDSAAADRSIPSEIHTTIDAGLQREVELAARRTIDALAHRHVSAASVLVLDHRSGEILAYVGSPDVGDDERLGANDGVLARRQPGSALKPFVYELAMERLGYTPATVLPDIELHLPTPNGGDYHPRDYDQRFHGPVRLREALGSSFNVPAAFTANQLGPGPLLGRLRDLGFASLDRPADDYGPGLALGDGEVTLLALTNAYATLARGGIYLPVRWRDDDRQAEPVRLLDEARTALVADILRDADARLPSFGERSVLELPFPVAAKTGTSKGFHDNVAVGFADDVTVGVWVGNFDGSAMHGVSGITGAGPLFRSVMLAAHGRVGSGRARPSANDAASEGGLAASWETAEICPLSGEIAGPACPHHKTERFIGGTAPHTACSMHVAVPVDRRNGMLADNHCPSDVVDIRTYETFPALFGAWAHEASRPLAPNAHSPLCPVEGVALADPARGMLSGVIGRHAAPGSTPDAAVLFPFHGARFVVDDAAAAPPSILLRATASADVTHVRFVIDGHSTALRAAPFALPWRLARGSHAVRVEPDHGAPSAAVAFVVD